MVAAALVILSHLVTVRCALRINQSPTFFFLLPRSRAQMLYESSVAFGMRKALQAEQGKAEMRERIAQVRFRLILIPFVGRWNGWVDSRVFFFFFFFFFVT